ncbi:MAG TPA: LLM class flavin-dependent oxidoreductase [Rugosimonospora sp.]|nr:LLM class flavin-dependent oxidoreductase [Rugosimonospora sp.]
MSTPPVKMRFHWSIPGSGAKQATRGAADRLDVNPVDDLDLQVKLCEIADDGGIDSLLLPIGFHRADPVTLAAYFGLATKRVRYMVAIRPGIVSPTYLVQQVNTVSVLIGGRISINVVAGYSSRELRAYGDFHSHDDRFGHSDEFWSICRQLWHGPLPVDFTGRYLTVEGARINTPFTGGREAPELYFGGSSELASDLAIKHGDALLRLGDTPDRLAPQLSRVLASGKEVGLLFSVIARPTHKQAVEAAYALIHAAGDSGRAVQDRFRVESAESVGFSTTYLLGYNQSDWPKPYLWSGGIPYMGPLSLALVGTPDDIAAALMEYRRIGVTQFLFHGRPDIESLPYFCQEILPRVRELERDVAGPVPAAVPARPHQPAR